MAILSFRIKVLELFSGFLQLLIFNHPDNVQSLSIHHGSGFFDLVTLSGGNIVNHKYHVTNQSVAVTPLRVGETVISVRDLCLVKIHPHILKLQQVLD